MRPLPPLRMLGLLATCAGCTGTLADVAPTNEDAASSPDAPDLDASDAQQPLEAVDVRVDAPVAQDLVVADHAAVPRDAARSDVAQDVRVPAPPPAFSSIAWARVGNGVAFKDSGNPDGQGVFIGYAGYGVTEPEVRAWVTALYAADLRARGVRYVYAVRGPSDFTYAAREIDNSRLIAHLLPSLASTTAPVLVAAHSAGGFVACELFELLYERGRDPRGASRGRVVYYDLDGISSCLDDAQVSNLQRAYFVRTRKGSGYSLDANSMADGAARWPRAGGLLTFDAARTGCDSDARYCLHISLVNTRPHDPSTALRTLDYTDFAGRPVNTWYLDVTHGR